jgi:hypothetical protein
MKNIKIEIPDEEAENNDDVKLKDNKENTENS